MIIECKNCHARFRLDESKIRGKGARVKCRRCGDMILVLRDDETGVISQEPGREGSLDLSSALREAPGEGRQAPGDSSPNNLIPFPGAGRVSEPPPPAERDEVDRAFDELLGGAAPPAPVPAAPAAEDTAGPVAETPVAGPPFPDWSLAAPDEPPVEAPPAFEAPAAGPPLPDLPLAAPEEPPVETPAAFEAPIASAPLPDESLATPPTDAAYIAEGDRKAPEFAPDEKLDLTPLLPEDPEAEEASTPAPPEQGFLVSDSETLDFLQHGEDGADISPRIASEPVELHIDSPPELESTAFPPSAEFVAPPSDLPLEGNATPDRAEPNPVPPENQDLPEAEPMPPRPIAAPYPETLPPPEPTPRSRTSRPLAAGVALVAVLVLAAGYFGFTAPGKQALQGLLSQLAVLVGGAGSAPASRYEVKNVIGYFESGAASPRILVIKGQVTNLSKVGKSGIRVHAALLDSADQVLGETVVYAGNVVPTARLKTGTRAALEKAVANPLGERLSNMDVLPGKTVPFMVLFFDAPENIDSYRLEARDND